MYRLLQETACIVDGKGVLSVGNASEQFSDLISEKENMQDCMNDKYPGKHQLGYLSRPVVNTWYTNVRNLSLIYTSL